VLGEEPIARREVRCDARPPDYPRPCSARRPELLLLLPPLLRLLLLLLLLLARPLANEIKQLVHVLYPL